MILSFVHSYSKYSPGSNTSLVLSPNHQILKFVNVVGYVQFKVIVHSQLSVSGSINSILPKLSSQVFSTFTIKFASSQVYTVCSSSQLTPSKSVVLASSLVIVRAGEYEGLGSTIFIASQVALHQSVPNHASSISSGSQVSFHASKTQSQQNPTLKS
ncbi:hypothetical protein ACFLY2_00840 [Patescibacteria group bacterium]